MDREIIVKEMEALFAAARSFSDYLKVWEKAWENSAEAVDVKWSLFEKAAIRLFGLWAGYYLLKKYPEEASKMIEVRTLARIVMGYYQSLEDLEMKVNYGYLLSVIQSNLQSDPAEAEKTDDEIENLVKEKGNVAIVLKVINARALTSRQRKDWSDAITIASKATRYYTEAYYVPEARQQYANILNNAGLSKLDLSDDVKEVHEKEYNIVSGINDLSNALKMYISVDPLPQKHLDGIQNRFVIAAYKLLLISGTEEEKELGRKIKLAFEAKDGATAKNLVINFKGYEKYDTGDQLIFFKIIHDGLRKAMSPK